MGVQGPTATQQLAEYLLDEPLEAAVKRMRDMGFSWQKVADQIANDTDGVIALNRETFRLWFGGTRPEDEGEI